MQTFAAQTERVRAMSETGLQTRLDFIKIDDGVRACLREVEPLVLRVLPDILDGFYAHIGQFPEMARMFRDTAHQRHAREKQLAHWGVILKGRFDQTYVDSVTRIGRAHHHLGLSPQWYIASYSLVMSGLQKAIETEIDSGRFGKKALARREHKARLLAAITAAALLDMDFSISVYLQSGLTAKQDQIDGLSRSFNTVVEAISSASTELQATAGALSQTARDTTNLTSQVAGASEEASGNVQSVAAATEELSGSIAEISRQVKESNRIAEKAVAQALTTDGRINELSQVATRIGDVVKLITAIAEQTNLLALNATIEAARAGEAGKGFAVVAQEVKALAAQTAKATGDIGNQIAAMQAVTHDSVAAIKEIGATIGRISEISAAIAAAVEQQGAATQEIAVNVTRAAEGTKNVASNIADVNHGAMETGSAADQVLSSARSLAMESNRLNAAVEQFVASVRAA
ncbi:protoglobin domain-containing protein [Rhodoplanes sp. SY1]|uniref:protoglobin domain-containing protein n=1 Tax=Rhodoplanes sp. SY1 TaxID=3166646 RepID=UPI0038B6A00F